MSGRTMSWPMLGRIAGFESLPVMPDMGGGYLDASPWSMGYATLCSRCQLPLKVVR